jgi:gliding motility-associated-like protein
MIPRKEALLLFNNNIAIFKRISSFLKGVFFFSLILLIKPNLSAQNLVPNWNFEEYDQCPNSGSQFDGYIKYWYNPTLYTPNYFNGCAPFSSFASVPSNFPGYQYPKSGEGYVMCVFFSPLGEDREYISVKLNSSLDSGKQYCIGYNISLTNHYSLEYLSEVGSMYAIDRIGILLTNTAIYYSNYDAIPMTPQVESETGVFFKDTLNWMCYKKKYTALGGERYITIGNFRNNANTNNIVVYPTLSQGAWYYIDDVFVYECNAVDSARAGNNATVCNGDSIQIGTHNYSDYKYKWTPSIGLSNDTIGNPFASPLVTTTYYLTCSKYIDTKDSVTVFIENCGIQMPNAFTPNGDGVNDFFKPKNTNFKELHGKIFNRWGLELFSFANPSDAWDGKYKGNDVSVGVYFYLISATFNDGVIQEQHGGIQLIR